MDRLCAQLYSKVCVRGSQKDVDTREYRSGRRAPRRAGGVGNGLKLFFTDSCCGTVRTLLLALWHGII